MPRHVKGEVRRLHVWRARRGGGQRCQRCMLERIPSRGSGWQFTDIVGVTTVSSSVPVCPGVLIPQSRPQLARERKITGAGPVDVRESILRTVEAARRAIYGADGKPVNDSRKYVEIVDRERRLQAHGADKVGRDSLWLTMSDGTEWWIKVEKMR